MITCVKMWETWAWVVVSIRLQRGLSVTPAVKRGTPSRLPSWLQMGR